MTTTFNKQTNNCLVAVESMFFIVVNTDRSHLHCFISIIRQLAMHHNQLTHINIQATTCQHMPVNLYIPSAVADYCFSEIQQYNF